MRRKITSGAKQWIVMVLLLPLVIFSSYSLAEPQYNSRLWKVKSLLHTSYLLGTMHVSDQEVVRIPNKLKTIIRNSETLALEVVLDGSGMQQMYQAFVFQDGQTLKSIIGSELYRQVGVAFQRLGYGVFNFNEFKPWAVSLLLNFPPPTGEEVLDKKLDSIFRSNLKPVVGLESVREQTQYFEAMNESDQIAFLSMSLEQLDDIEASTREIKRLYLKGDLSALQDFTNAQIIRIQHKPTKELMKNLIDTRNQLMVKRAQPLLANGNALIAVGALHLPGERGVIQLLRKKGYAVTPVYMD